MKIKPLKNNVVIEAEEKKEVGKTEAGIYLPETAETSGEKPQIGKVVAIGDGKKIRVKVGQKVVYNKYTGTEIDLEEKNYLIVKSDDILAVIE